MNLLLKTNCRYYIGQQKSNSFLPKIFLKSFLALHCIQLDNDKLIMPSLLKQKLFELSKNESVVFIYLWHGIGIHFL